jgi:hypothetical protein
MAAGVLLSFGQAHAQPPYGLPLAALAGNWAGPTSGTYSVCYNSHFTAVEDCSTAPNAVFYSQVVLDQFTQDTKGNSCHTQRATISPEFPSPGGPAVILTSILAGKTTSYNRATETGIVYFTVYSPGPGTYCNGSILMNAGADPIGVATVAFTVSQSGNRQDTIVQTFKAEPISDAGNLVVSGYVNRQ